MNIHFRSKSFAWWILVMLVIIVLSVLAYRLSYVLYYNHSLLERFSLKIDDSAYQREVPMEEMDLTEYDRIFPNTIALISYDFIHNIKTPVTLRYYSAIPANDADYALEIAEGTTITAIPLKEQSLGIHEVGYGYTSYPTYTKGWRYVRPFKTEGAETALAQNQYYYIRIESLEAVLEKAISANRPLTAMTKSQYGLKQKATHHMARYIDQALYDRGIYLSLDLPYRLWNRGNIVLLVLTVILASLLVFQTVRISRSSSIHPSA